MQSNEEIVRMARESGLWYKVGFPKEIERFAALVAAAERDACADIVEKMGMEGYGTLAIAAVIGARGKQK